MPEAWKLQARCRGVDPELFFPDKNGAGDDVAEARAICRDCPVRTDCLEWALDNAERFGVWGGHTERERRRIKRERLKGPDAAYEARRRAQLAAANRRWKARQREEAAS